MKYFLYFLIIITNSTFNFCYQTDVHQYIADEAYKLLKIYFPNIQYSELAQQLGTIGNFGEHQWETGLIQAGVFQEDEEDVI